MKISKHICLLLTILSIVVLSGCAATPTHMAPTKEDTSMETSQKSTLLFSLTTRNEYRPSSEPHAMVMLFDRNGSPNREDKLTVMFDKESRDESSETEYHYLARVPLAPGHYVIEYLVGIAGVWPIAGEYYAPLQFDIDVKPNTVVYLGHLDAVVVERHEGELRAGPMYPPVQQGLTGMIGGTWKVSVADHYDSDMAAFRSQFPALRTVEVQKDILPAWDQKRAYDWWAKDGAPIDKGSGRPVAINAVQ